MNLYGNAEQKSIKKNEDKDKISIKVKINGVKYSSVPNDEEFTL